MEMARRPAKSSASSDQKVSMSTDDLLMAALERGGDTSKTGRFLMTFKEGAAAAGVKALQARKLRVAHANDFTTQAVDLLQVGDADALMLPEIGVALVSSEAVAEHGLTTAAFAEEDASTHSVDPEYFMFASQINPTDYLKGVLRTAEMIAQDLGDIGPTMISTDVSAQAVGVTWGLSACRVPQSQFSGKGIKIAVLDTGFDLGHPEFTGRSFVTNTFVGQPVQDLHGHGTHTTGTACGPLAPTGPIQRYGIGYDAQIFVGKVLTNSGSGTQMQVLAGTGR
jgi:subtilisin